MNKKWMAKAVSGIILTSMVLGSVGCGKNEDGEEEGKKPENTVHESLVNGSFEEMDADGRWADMGTYVMDLSAYLGEELYVVLCDEQADGWAIAFFDEVVTYYEEVPDYENNADSVPDGGTAEEVLIPWQLLAN